MNSMQLITVAQAVMNISSICLATYTAGVVTLLGSALVASCLPGTVLSPTINSTNIMKTDLNSVTDMISSSVEENILSEDILTANFMSASLNCNQSQQNCESIETNDATDINWKWWLNSMMIRLSEYSDPESKKTLHTTNEHADTSITTKFFFDITISDEPLIKFWKQILDIDLKILLHEWRYYANCVQSTKLTFDHQH